MDKKEKDINSKEREVRKNFVDLNLDHIQEGVNESGMETAVPELIMYPIRWTR